MDLFDADQAFTALARKQRSRTTVLEAQMEEMNPGLAIAKQLYGNYFNSLMQ